MDWVNDVDWQARCSQLLAGETPRAIGFEKACAAADAVATDAVIEALATLDELPRAFATPYVEMKLVAAGATAEQLVTVADSFHSAVDAGAVERMDADLMARWAKQVGVHLPAACVVARSKYGDNSSLIAQTALALVETGSVEGAAAVAAEINDYYRRDCAETWAKIGIAATGELRERALMAGANAGNARPMIQDGGEEAEAHGVFLQTVAKAQLDAAHEAVQTSVNGLRRLGKHRAPKDVRSYGVMVAAIAAARNGEASWREIALELTEMIWTDSLKSRAEAAMLLTRKQNMSTGEFAEAATAIVSAHDGSVDEALARFADGQKIDVPKDVEAALEQWDGYGDRAVRTFIKGCRLGVDDAKLTELIESVKPKDRPQAFVEGAAGFVDDEARAAKYLRLGYPQGDEFGIFSRSILHLLDEASLARGESFYANQGEEDALFGVVTEYLRRDMTEAASRAMARIGQPTVDGDGWTPYYVRGNRSFAPDEAPQPPPPVDDIKAAIKACKLADDLWPLVQAHKGDADAREMLAKAAKLKKFRKRKQDDALVRCLIALDEIDTAFEVAEERQDYRVKSRMARELDATQEIVLGLCAVLRDDHAAYNEKRANCLLTLCRCFPQFITNAVYDVARTLIQVGGEQWREPVIALSKDLFKRAGDRSYATAGLAHGFHCRGEVATALELVAQTTDSIGADSVYVSPPFFVNAFAQMAAREASPILEDAIAAALDACLTRGRSQMQFEKVMRLERAYRYLWMNGQYQPVLDCLPRLPQTIASELVRSIWTDIAHCPAPLPTLDATWPTSQLPESVAHELIGALVASLPEEAQVTQSIRSLVS